MSIPYIGELAALATSLCFAIGPTLFALAGRQVGSVIVNRGRLAIVFVYLLIAHQLAYGSLLPIGAGDERWLWFSISGVIGLVLGDAALFQALVMIGPRLTLLIFALAPVLGALLGWLFLGEMLTALQLSGILITLAGVTWVVGINQNEDAEEGESQPRREYLIGIGYAILGAAGQAGGLFAAKKGFSGDFPALSGQIIRTVAAFSVLWLLTLVGGKAKQTIQSLRSNPKAVQHIAIGAIIGPFIGVWFSLVSVQNTSLGIASTLQSLPPVFMIPISYFAFKERISWQAVVGTIVALAGVAVLFLV